MLPTIVIVGRPNVGKSTFFNRLVGRRSALVDDSPGVTRDRREGEGRVGDLRFRIVDTAGLEDAFDDSLPARMRRQTEAAIADADAVLLMIDARAGVTPLDEHFADWLRTRRVPVVLIANKCEGRAGRDGLNDCYRLGLGEPVPFSAEHGQGISLLYDALRERVDTVVATEAEAEDKPGGDIDFEALLQGEDLAARESEPKGPLQLAIVGRPNVGKSTLVNALLGEDRLLTGPEAGITRDAIAIEWKYNGRTIALVDTAGLRRRARVAEKLEKLSVGETRRAIQFAQVVALVLDGTDGLERQDLNIARHVVDEGRALILVINKWDLVTDRKAALEKLRDRLSISLPQATGVPIVTLSALTGRSLDRLMPAVMAAYDVWNRRVTTADLNGWLRAKTDAHPPPLASNKRRIRLRYATQAKSRPPTFVIFGNRPEDLPDSYVRYLENSMREDFGLAGTPIRILMRKGDNPYDGDTKARGTAKAGNRGKAGAKAKPGGKPKPRPKSKPKPAVKPAAKRKAARKKAGRS